MRIDRIDSYAVIVRDLIAAKGIGTDKPATLHDA